MSNNLNISSKQVNSRQDELAPNYCLIQESNSYMAELLKSAKTIVNEKEHLKTALDKAANECQEKIAKALAGKITEVDLLASKKTTHNKAFLKNFKIVDKLLKDYTAIVSHLSDSSLKKLDYQGHQRRSQGRKPLQHQFSSPKQGDEATKLYIQYLPCGRYTMRQQALMGKAPSIDRNHSTTSHNRRNLVLGNSSFVRMKVGIKQDGNNTLLLNSFSGPGARMPYEDFKGANDYKRLAIKAITLINQEEAIQTFAQREFEQISQLGDEQLWDAIQNKNAEAIRPDERKALVESYLEHYPLSVTEMYTQVVSAGQPGFGINASEFQKEQFEYVRAMMDSFDGGNANVSIQTGDGSEINLDVAFKARMGSWGVNEFRTWGRGVTKRQNKRCINQLTDDVINTITPLFPDNHQLEGLKELLKSFNTEEILELQTDIDRQQTHLLAPKEEYRKALFAYFEEYNKDKEQWDPKNLTRLKSRTESLEAQIKQAEKNIYNLHEKIDAIRSANYNSQKPVIYKTLNELKNSISEKIRDVTTSADDKKNYQHVYNSCAYLFEASQLHHEDSWHHKQNNFKLQTLTALLAVELGHASTIGCKSNNDRGQRLAQKVAGSTLLTALSDDGLYSGDFFAPRKHQSNELTRAEIIEYELLTIQASHHRENTGVSGGKYRMLNPSNFIDNGLLGKFASWAKIKNMKPKSAFTKNVKSKLAVGIALSLVAVSAVFAFPPLGVALGAALGLSVIGAAATTASLLLPCGYLAATAIDAIKNKLKLRTFKAKAENFIQQAEQESFAPAEEDNSPSSTARLLSSSQLSSTQASENSAGSEKNVSDKGSKESPSSKNEQEHQPSCSITRRR